MKSTPYRREHNRQVNIELACGVRKSHLSLKRARVQGLAAVEARACGGSQPTTSVWLEVLHLNIYEAWETPTQMKK